MFIVVNIVRNIVGGKRTTNCKFAEGNSSDCRLNFSIILKHLPHAYLK
jgi:hypothetical protein